MFIDDPIIANLPQKKQQKFFIEEAFRSQLKLVSDTVAKEMIFILEFFDFKIANQTQQTYMFNKIFRNILLKFYTDKFKENCEWCVFDLYSILIMIQINEDCKKQMQRVYRMNILDSFLHKISIYVLWPRFSQVFDMHLENIQRCEVRNFRVNNQLGLHVLTTVRCYQFLIGLLKLQEIMNLSEQN